MQAHWTLLLSRTFFNSTFEQYFSTDMLLLKTRDFPVLRIWDKSWGMKSGMTKMALTTSTIPIVIMLRLVKMYINGLCFDGNLAESDCALWNWGWTSNGCHLGVPGYTLSLMEIKKCENGLTVFLTAWPNIYSTIDVPIKSIHCFRCKVSFVQ